MVQSILITLVLAIRRLRRALNLPTADLSKREGPVSNGVRVAEEALGVTQPQSLDKDKQ
jgi:hypothetical protein